MQLKFKVILTVFLVVAICYVFYFTMDHMHSITKKEMFTEDVEHYMEPPTQESTKPKTPVAYDQRIQVLDTVEKLDIQDKTVKGNLLEYILGESTLKTLAAKTQKEKEEFIQSAYKNIASASLEGYEEPSTAPEPPPAAPEPKATSSLSPMISDKIEKALGGLKVVESSLRDIITTPKKPNTPTIEKFTQQGMVEGYENIRGYALV